MAKNHGAAALLIASLLVVAVALADARFTATQMQRGSINGVYALTKAVPALTCNKVSAVQTGETCSSLAESAGLTQEDFLGFNPNINCIGIFVGQWVCLDASSA
ncbi:lysM domain-containing protein ARB_03438-like [Triticum urartu]|uniref:LysM domain-containing protein n=1 Tax=Triticum urartu TaxID=4572 RepID=A0A8R7RBY5_TRIUA|nr:lysM domain-containing protein ARB_03438-like [Triticum urartu]